MKQKHSSRKYRGRLRCLSAYKNPALILQKTESIRLKKCISGSTFILLFRSYMRRLRPLLCLYGIHKLWQNKIHLIISQTKTTKYCLLTIFVLFLNKSETENIFWEHSDSLFISQIWIFTDLCQFLSVSWFINTSLIFTIEHFSLFHHVTEILSCISTWWNKKTLGCLPTELLLDSVTWNISFTIESTGLA